MGPGRRRDDGRIAVFGCPIITKYGIGQPVSRFEDPRLLRGQGHYQDDVNLPGQAYAVFLRSPHAHARIKAINTAAATAAPGVLAVFNGEDVAGDGLGTMTIRLQRKRPDGSPMFAWPHPGLARDPGLHCRRRCRNRD